MFLRPSATCRLEGLGPDLRACISLSPCHKRAESLRRRAVTSVREPVRCATVFSKSVAILNSQVCHFRWLTQQHRKQQKQLQTTENTTENTVENMTENRKRQGKTKEQNDQNEFWVIFLCLFSSRLFPDDFPTKPLLETVP